jgi:RalA-binding protein 1
MAPDSLSSTPNRSREKLPFPISSNPSPGPSQRPTISSSLSSLPLTSELLISTHSAAPDPKLAALEQAINERNTLSAQNAQLWKLIEKQRAGYNKILKELERIRGERDSYKAKLGIGNSSLKRDPTTKQQSDDNCTLSSLLRSIQ